MWCIGATIKTEEVHRCHKEIFDIGLTNGIRFCVWLQIQSLEAATSSISSNTKSLINGN